MCGGRTARAAARSGCGAGAEMALGAARVSCCRTVSRAGAPRPACAAAPQPVRQPARRAARAAGWRSAPRAFRAAAGRAGSTQHARRKRQPRDLRGSTPAVRQSGRRTRRRAARGSCCRSLCGVSAPRPACAAAPQPVRHHAGVRRGDGRSAAATRLAGSVPRVVLVALRASFCRARVGSAHPARHVRRPRNLRGSPATCAAARTPCGGGAGRPDGVPPAPCGAAH